MTYDAIEILLVEDDPQDVELTLRVLHAEPVKNRVRVVRDGEEALDYLFRRGLFSDRPADDPPKLILLDLKLPKVDGLQVLQELKSSEECRSIPVVVLTSSGEQRDIVETYKLGVNSYIQKPVDIAQFRQSIKALGFYWMVMNRAPT